MMDSWHQVAIMTLALLAMRLRVNQYGGAWQNGHGFSCAQLHDFITKWVQLGRHALNPEGMGWKELGRHLMKDYRTIRKHVLRFLATGCVGNLDRHSAENAPRKLLWHHLVYLRWLTVIYPSQCLHEFRQCIFQDCGVNVSEPTISRALAWLRLTLKTRVVAAAEKMTPANLARYVSHLRWQRSLTFLDKTKLVFVDEFGIRKNDAARTRLRSEAGTIAFEIDEYVKARKINFAAALGWNGPLPCSFAFPNDTQNEPFLGKGFGHEAFEFWFIWLLLPTVLWEIGRGAIIVMDNASQCAFPITGIEIVNLYGPQKPSLVGQKPQQLTNGRKFAKM
eukprot:scaffold39373_cov43-Prasinocladus_malaysianus.AAC.3